MSSSRLTATTLAFGAILVGALPWALASCATTDGGGGSSDRDPTKVPEAGSVDGGDAGATTDGGCDPSDPNCVTKPVGCDEAAFCPSPTNLSTALTLTAVWGSSKNDVWASGSGGTVLHWDGATWVSTPVPTETTLPIKNTFHALWGSGPNDVWLASATDVIFHSDGFKNGTVTWVRAPNATGSEYAKAPIYAAWGTSADDFRFGGAPCTLELPGTLTQGNQLVKKPSNAGFEWSRVEGFGTINGIWGSSPDDIWIVADNSSSTGWQFGQTLHGTRSGSTDFVWADVDSRASATLLGIWGSSASDVWTVGEAGAIRHLGSSGDDWSVVDSPTRETLHAVWGTGPKNVWAVGNSGTILHWDGTAWSPLVAAFPVNKKKPHLYGVWGTGSADVWIVGDGIVLHSTGGGQ
ncbi:Type IV fimbrial biogenesis protein PilY1 [Labilithrix luteola]|uniref:Type IV fimbrial biogenesis protein PilY1 n=1 Tax=Labilithrix luteola TaxID=1391654 RepID=A0A0K1PPU4_9BACT|nr:hypothetical protein [Labilithrix luteola]AKU95560.1 Type IV fimbrial biogenesis protein PilY1 [Labilithrix luteola]